MALEIVIGPMFSGKSSYALSYIRRQRAIGKKVVVIKPNIDNRYSEDDVLVTHDREQTHCMIWPVNELLNPSYQQIRESDCIVLEEAQFFRGVRTFVGYALRAYKKDILVVGLDGDAQQEQFGELLNCIPWATKVTKLCALCKYCGDGTLAPFTKKLGSAVSQQVDVGGDDKYVSVCLKHLTDIE
jgi:thymidine kinase